MLQRILQPREDTCSAATLPKTPTIYKRICLFLNFFFLTAVKMHKKGHYHASVHLQAPGRTLGPPPTGGWISTQSIDIPNNLVLRLNRIGARKLLGVILLHVTK